MKVITDGTEQLIDLLANDTPLQLPSSWRFDNSESILCPYNVYNCYNNNKLRAKFLELRRSYNLPNQKCINNEILSPEKFESSPLAAGGKDRRIAWNHHCNFYICSFIIIPLCPSSATLLPDWFLQLCRVILHDQGDSESEFYGEHLWFVAQKLIAWPPIQEQLLADPWSLQSPHRSTSSQTRRMKKTKKKLQKWALVAGVVARSLALDFLSPVLLSVPANCCTPWQQSFLRTPQRRCQVLQGSSLQIVFPPWCDTFER